MILTLIRNMPIMHMPYAIKHRDIHSQKSESDAPMKGSVGTSK